MKKNLTIYIAIIALTLSFTANGYAQWGDLINQAKAAIEKKTNIKKDKTNNPQTDTPARTVNAADQPATSGQSAASSDKWADHYWPKYQLEEIAKYKKKLDEWNPATQYFPEVISNDDYYLYALSPSARNEWLSEKALPGYRNSLNNKLDPALDALKASLEKRLPENVADPKAFPYRNAPEEKLVIANMAAIVGLKVYKIGFNQTSWLIDKNEFGIPTARYKHGMVYGRNPKVEDQFCRFWLINVIQDYSGGGTYGATYASYIKTEFAPCPAGK